MIKSQPSPEAAALVYEAATRENELRMTGASPDRVSSDWARRYGAKFAKLAAAEHSSEYLLPPEAPRVEMPTTTEYEPDFRQRQMKDW